MIVVDTDVVSFLFKRDSRSALYAPHFTAHLPAISFMTLAELELWALSRGWGARRRQEMRTYLRRYSVQPFTSELCRLWAEVTNGARRNGRPIDTADAWIAATALHLGVPLITHNRNHFLGVDGLTVISES